MAHRLERRSEIAALLLVSCVAAPVAAEEDTLRWSATLEAAAHEISSHEADDDVTGFFDRYRFTPNKDDDVPVEIGLRDAAFDWMDESETPRLRFRLDSPTSNLGVSDPSEPFWNQRARLSGWHPGVGLALDYRRLRTETLRRFPDPASSGLVFTDLTRPDDRFYRERTGFDGALTLRSDDAFELPRAASFLSPELELRGGFEARDGRPQRRLLLPPTNDWLSLRGDLDQEVAQVGGGALVVPGGLFTLALDVDHERFRENADPRTDASLGAPFPSSARTIHFVPDTDRTTGAVRLRGGLGERARIRGGLQLSQLEQVSGRTPLQRAAGLDDNRLLYASASLAGDVILVGGLSADAFFKFDRRDNDIDRDTAIFNPTGGGQVAEFLDRWERIEAGGELSWSFHRGNRVSIGAKAEWADRDLEFVREPTALRILPANAAVSDETESVTVFARTRLRPLSGLDLRGEVGYRDAPKTGYAIELDDYVYGRADVSYVVPFARPLVLSAFGRGGSGSNDDFEATSGQGPTPSGGRVDRDFERTDFAWGITASLSPIERLTVFASLFQSRDDQDFDLVVSDLPRFFQDGTPVNFSVEGPIDYRSEHLGVLAGASVRIGEATDASLRYAFDRVEARYGSGSGSGRIGTIRAQSEIDADIHRIGVGLAREIFEGLRVSAGYRLDVYDDRSPVHGAVGAVRPFDLGSHQHTFTLGVTFSNEILERFGSSYGEDS